MDLNADFSKRVVLHSEQLEWQSSPMPGVDRRMLDRLGDEVARATTIVRYAPGSHFSPHVHTGGEEFIVLDGVFQDEHGDFPAGSYIRNPPESSHTPGSEQGCVIFVKLWQFDLADRQQVRTDTNTLSLETDAYRSDVSSAELFSDDREHVSVEQWQTDASVSEHLPGGAELLVLEGDAIESGDSLAKHSWLRIPPGGELNATAGSNGARVWIKRGHLTDIKPPNT